MNVESKIKNMKNEMNIHEIIDMNDVLNQEIYPAMEEMVAKSYYVTEHDVWDLVVRYTIDYDLWQETDDVWYNEMYLPMLNAIKEDFTIAS